MILIYIFYLYIMFINSQPGLIGFAATKDYFLLLLRNLTNIFTISLSQ